MSGPVMGTLTFAHVPARVLAPFRPRQQGSLLSHGHRYQQFVKNFEISAAKITKMTAKQTLVRDLRRQSKGNQFTLSLQTDRYRKVKKAGNFLGWEPRRPAPTGVSRQNDSGESGKPGGVYSGPCLVSTEKSGSRQ
jgi:hypothetical protein